MEKDNSTKKWFIAKRNLKKLQKRTRRKKKLYIFTDISWRTALRKNPRFIEIEAPANLTLKYEDVEEVLVFISNIKKMGKKGFFIHLKLSNVIEIGEGAIALLLSVISDLERKRIFFKGEKPLHEHSKNTLERSGFFEHMTGSVSKINSVSKNKILKTGGEKTDQKELGPQIHNAMSTIWGVEGRCPALYGGLGEMMRNSCEHAFPLSSPIIWHLGISHFEEENCCKFSFVDNGQGIIKTYNEKGLLKIIVKYFKNNAEILKLAFEDGITSRTGLSWRGKGLPTIYEMYLDNIITNLVVITNDVYLDFDRKIYKKISTNFSGTYYFWKIDTTCEKLVFL